MTSTEPIPLPASRSGRARPPRRRLSIGWWTTVAAAGLISVMTAPGQTAGLSVFTDPLIDGLGIDRTAIALSYLIGTLIGAAAQPSSAAPSTGGTCAT